MLRSCWEYRGVRRGLSGFTIPFLAAVWFSSPVAYAGNLDSFYLGSEAALNAGAVTADADGGGAIWYNPAGLANVPGTRVDVSASAYSVRIGGYPDFSGATPGSQVKRLTTLDINVVPTAFAMVWRWGDGGVGLGVFVPRQEQTLLRTQVFAPVLDGGTGPAASEFGVDVFSQTQDYYAGPSFGLALNSRVSVGASLFGMYRTELSTAYAELAAQSGDAKASVTTHSTVDWRQIGAQLVLSVQLQPKRDWHIGVTYRLPSLRLYEMRQDVNSEAQGAAEGDQSLLLEHETSFEDVSRFSNAFVDPMRFHGGVAYTSGPSRIGLDVSYQAPFINSSVELDWKPTLNARVGGHRRLSDEITLGAGVFTDRSPVRAVQHFGDSDLDYYGLTISADIGTAYDIARKGATSERIATPQVASAPEAMSQLRFGTCIAFTYALGVGNVVQGNVDFSKGADIIEVPESVVAHEILVHVSSSLIQ